MSWTGQEQDIFIAKNTSINKQVCEMQRKNTSIVSRSKNVKMAMKDKR